MFPQFTTASLTPRYRLYHPVTRAHLHTTDANEYSVLGTGGWIQEGISGRIFDGPTSVGGVQAVPLYRLYFLGGTRHFWTTDRNEYLTLIRIRSFDVGDGPDGFLLPQQVVNTNPLFRLLFCCSGSPIHHWTTDGYENSVLSAPGGGWISEGITGYIYPVSGPSLAAGMPASKASYTTGEPGPKIEVLTRGPFGRGPAVLAPEIHMNEETVDRGAEAAVLVKGLDWVDNSERVVVYLNGVPAQVIAIERQAESVSAVRIRVPDTLQPDRAAVVTVRRGEWYSQSGVTLKVVARP